VICRRTWQTPWGAWQIIYQLSIKWMADSVWPGEIRRNAPGTNTPLWGLRERQTNPLGAWNIPSASKFNNEHATNTFSFSHAFASLEELENSWNVSSSLILWHFPYPSIEALRACTTERTNSPNDHDTNGDSQPLELFSMLGVASRQRSPAGR